MRVIVLEEIESDINGGWSWAISPVSGVHMNGVARLGKPEACAERCMSTPGRALSEAMKHYTKGEPCAENASATG